MSGKVDEPVPMFFGAFGQEPEQLLFVIEAEDAVQAHARALMAASVMKLQEGQPIRLAELATYPMTVPVLYEAFFQVRPACSRRVVPSTTTLQ